MLRCGLQEIHLENHKKGALFPHLKTGAVPMSLLGNKELELGVLCGKPAERPASHEDTTPSATQECRLLHAPLRQQPGCLWGLPLSAGAQMAQEA